MQKKMISRVSLLLAAVLLLGCFGFAQGLNWEGQTGALLTPFAYTASSNGKLLGKPEVSFHYLNGGSVIGNDYQFSVTEGIGKRFEVGFTQSMSSTGDNALAFLFNGGYSSVHGKLTLIPENAAKTKWVPAIAVGSIGRFNNERVYWNAVGDTTTSKGTSGDFYFVATKTITQIKGLPFVLSGGEKVTNSSIMGIAGQAASKNGEQAWKGSAFGAAAFVVKGPAKSALIFGTEAVQQPKYLQPLGQDVSIPTSLSYFVRVVPHLEGSPLQVDAGLVQAAGRIADGVDIKARHQFGMGISYHF
ncbi:MAG TPA: DUF3034 family protein [candidate division Zixibacteria bacterium]|nr:DUF3034 family protein [candidate division Zixibacteria bacterium]